jgi:hypothetical protein
MNSRSFLFSEFTVYIQKKEMLHITLTNSISGNKYNKHIREEYIITKLKISGVKGLYDMLCYVFDNDMVSIVAYNDNIGLHIIYDKTYYFSLDMIDINKKINDCKKDVLVK